MSKTTLGKYALLVKDITELEATRYEETNPMRREAIASTERMNQLYEEQLNLQQKLAKAEAEQYAPMSDFVKTTFGFV